MIKGIHHVAIRVTDFDRSFKFYTEVLGMKPVLCWGEGEKRAVMLNTGDGDCIEMFAGGERKAEGSWCHLALRTDDVDKDFAAAIEAGATVQSAPNSLTINGKPAPKDIRIAFIYGYDGEIIEFFQEL